MNMNDFEAAMVKAAGYDPRFVTEPRGDEFVSAAVKVDRNGRPLVRDNLVVTSVALGKTRPEAERNLLRLITRP